MHNVVHTRTQGQVWHGVSVQGEEDRTDSRSQAGEYLEEGGQARGRARGRDHEAAAAPAPDTALRRYRERQADLRHTRVVRIYILSYADDALLCSCIVVEYRYTC